MMASMPQEPRRITGTHIYHMCHCPRAVALDLHEDRSNRRAITPLEEFVRKRGRDWEAEFLTGLDYAEPQYARADFASGAQKTIAMMQEGVTGISQGVLQEPGFLGIPDLLRREPGSSLFGDYHYVVGDIKSSGRPRSDQVLQVAFYSRMLAKLQEHAPEYGYLILKDGREERFSLLDLQPVLQDVQQRVVTLRDNPDAAEPFFSRNCASCHWSELCVPAMQEDDDLSLVQGMTRGLRSTLGKVGCGSGTALAGLVVERTAKQTHLEPVLLRRLKQSAKARVSKRPLFAKRSKEPDGQDAAVLCMLKDAYLDRVLYFGVRYPAGPKGKVYAALPQDQQGELPAFLDLLAKLPKKVPLWHYGGALPRWYLEASRGHANAMPLDARFTDLARRLRGVAAYPGPVFGLDDHVRYLLGEDPHRQGEAGAAAMWLPEEDGEERVRAKGQSDLSDLAALLQALRREEENDSGS